jgi:hypothetical protein
VKRIIVTVGAALVVAVPAATGLIGNTSFAQSVPVRVPSHAIIVDYHGGQRATTTEPRDDQGGQRPTSTTETRDDAGGQRPTSTTEPGDDRRAAATTGPGSARVSGGGSGEATVSGSSSDTGGKGGHGQKAGGKGSGTDGSGHT